MRECRWMWVVLVMALTGCQWWPWTEHTRATLQELAVATGTCGALDASRVHQKPPALFEIRDGQCQQSDPFDPGKQIRFSDRQCQHPILFKPASVVAHCRDALSPAGDRLGNAALLTPVDEQSWTVTPWSELKLTLVTPSQRQMALMRQVRYKSVAVTQSLWVGNDAEGRPVFQTVPRGNGTCHLEMRIYTPDIERNDLKPLIMLHGGGWSSRGLNFVGLETYVAQFTDRGFVVFAPFYRLVGEGDGNPECNKSTDALILEDTRDAFRWVREHGHEFGATDDKVTVVGASAGGFLGAWLVTEFPEEIRKGMLLYPPTDFTHYILQVRQAPWKMGGRSILERFLGDSLFHISLDDPGVVAGTLPIKIAANPKRFPPVLLFHGQKDELVPSIQSVRLCNAYGGNPDKGTATDFGGLGGFGIHAWRHACGDSESQLFLFAGAGHTLDLCSPFMTCPAGNASSQQAVRTALKYGLDWLVLEPRD